MGVLTYGVGAPEIDIEDRTLAHLQFVIAMKLRRNEQFLLTWEHGMERGGGRSAVWISPSIPVHFRYSGSKQPRLNRAWLEALMEAANGPTGLHHVPEPAGPPVPPRPLL
ncbi:hypothetical protein CLV46_0381 [Diaminobutyricimonas aerilata]|uniref:DUF7882 domain-containing protein n=1 Tax=Diaminobutyricimonas aerilata TaxID=1162967 RepID=A0A2M9CG77_9MICO|nr:ATP-dependent DNA ligase [Diaminobutyricimonas aerilata]PJJ70852.1 hypothetical protein CLV46_0381 [Diaminobutyricimonas aerilata]